MSQEDNSHEPTEPRRAAVRRSGEPAVSRSETPAPAVNAPQATPAAPADDRDPDPRSERIARPAPADDGPTARPSAAPRATVHAGAADRLAPRDYLERLFQLFVRDAQLLGADRGAGHLQALAGEIAEFGLLDHERAQGRYTSALEHTDTPPAAAAGLRRHARQQDGRDQLRLSYERELERAPELDRRCLSAIGLAMLRMRLSDDPQSVLQILLGFEAERDALSLPVRLVWLASLEDALVRAGRLADAWEAHLLRFDQLRGAVDLDAELVSAAAIAVAVAAEQTRQDPEEVLRWYDLAFQARRTPEAARPLLRWAFDRQETAVAASLLDDLATETDDADVRAASRYELGMLRAYRLQDRAGGLEALAESIRSGGASPIAAAAFLTLARSSHGNVMPDEVVDALSARLEFAASGMERADLLTQMAQRFDTELEMPDAAVEMAREALDEHPTWVPALRLLNHIYSRDGHWQPLLELGEAQLAFETAHHERLRLHDRLAAICLDQLHVPRQAEHHLRASIELEWRLEPVRRLARLLGDQYRWDELYRLLANASQHIVIPRERAWLLEQAAEVAEHRLRDVDLAVRAFRDLLDLDPGSTSAMAGLDRLLSGAERWDELLDLYEHELTLQGASDPARVVLLTRCAELSALRLADAAKAEHYYIRALELDPLCDSALRGLGQLLKDQGRWSDLVEMTDRELDHATTPAHRARCLRQLGELYATRLEDASSAVVVYRRLAELGGGYREEALIWLERLYEAQGMPEARLDVLEARHELAEEPAWKARVAYRIAELVEWESNRAGEAFRRYLESLVEPLAVGEALSALDRLWCGVGVTAADHARALAEAREVAARSTGANRRAALQFVVERAGTSLPEPERRMLWEQLAREWRHDVRAAESVAWSALRAGHVEQAEHVRAQCASGPVEAARGAWSQLDRGVAVTVSPEAWQDLAGVAAFLERERGGLSGFAGAESRELFAGIASGEVSVGELASLEGDETFDRLGVMSLRGLGRLDEARQRWHRLAVRLGDPRRSMRAWLDLCAEDWVSDDERATWLRRAAELGCFDSPLRDELYGALQGCGDLEGLADALQVHVRAAGTESARIAALALRRGRVLELLGRRDDALDALRYGTVHAPSHVPIALEKSRLELLGDDVESARSTLEDVLNSGCSGRDRVEVLCRLADLHGLDGGDRARALRALEDACELSGNTRDARLRLAQAHAAFGEPDRAVRLYETTLDLPVDESDVRHWIQLARLYVQRLEQPEKAERVLWAVFEGLPHRPASLQALEDFYRNHGEPATFADRLRDVLVARRVTLSDERRAELWSYVGELNLSVAERFVEAEQAFRAALEQGADRGRALLGQARATARQAGRGRQAATLLVEAVSLDAYDQRSLGDAAAELERLYEELQDSARLRVARQLRRTLGEDVVIEELDVPRDPTREVGPSTAWSLIGHGLMDETERWVLAASAPLAEKIFGRRDAGRRGVRGRRPRTETQGAFLQFVDGATRCLDAAVPRVLVSDQVTDLVAVEADQFVVPEASVGDASPLRSRFWAGCAAGLSFTQLAPYLWVDDEDVLELWRAVALKSRDLDVSGGSLLADEVGGLLVTPQRRAAAKALREATEVLQDPRGGWARAIRAFSDRAGLIMCGDLSVAVEEVLRAGGAAWDLRDERAQRELARSRRARDLIRYALSDAYYLTRYELGLGRRPWVLE